MIVIPSNIPIQLQTKQFPYPLTSSNVKTSLVGIKCHIKVKLIEVATKTQMEDKPCKLCDDYTDIFSHLTLEKT